MKLNAEKRPVSCRKGFHRVMPGTGKYLDQRAFCNTFAMVFSKNRRLGQACKQGMLRVLQLNGVTGSPRRSPVDCAAQTQSYGLMAKAYAQGGAWELADKVELVHHRLILLRAFGKQPGPPGNNCGSAGAEIKAVGLAGGNCSGLPQLPQLLAECRAAGAAAIDENNQ